MRIENLTLWAMLFLLFAGLFIGNAAAAVQMWWDGGFWGTAAANSSFWMAVDIFGMFLNEKDFFAWVRDEDLY